MNKQNIILAVVVFASIVLFRLLNMPNFNPTIAIAILCGALVSNRALAFAIPMLALFVCDLGLAVSNQDSSYMEYITHGGFIANYAFYLASIFAGKAISSRINTAQC